MTSQEIRKGFAEARRRALSTQGKITYEKVKENQKTMREFYLKLERETADLPLEAVKIIDEHFWNLILK